MKKKKVIAQQVLSAVLATAIASNSSGFTEPTTIVKAMENAVKNEEIIAVNGEISGEPTIVEPEDLPSNDELFKGYLEQLFYGTSTYSLGFGESDLSALNENEKKVYKLLKDFVTEVANGDRESTEFYICPEDTEIDGQKYQKNIDLTDIKFSKDFSWEEGDGEAVRTQASKELQEEISQEIDCNKIIRTLLLDCPYELYWFAKTEGYIASPRIFSSWSPSNKKGTATAEYFQFSFIVDKHYAKADNKYLVDNTQVQRAKDAKANADKIVADHASEDDYTKLKSYLKEICDLNEYNHDAASSSPNTIGIDPWQLVYVFDGDPDTNGVCEGYSKAFAYLFEKSSFQNDIKCYIISGNLDGGGHMWNIVTMEDGKNYMVDVTNCDGNTVGSPDKLFLAGLPGTVEDGYIFTSQYGTKCSFTYKEDTLKVYSKNILTLASDSYSYKPKTAGEITASDYKASYIYGDAIPEPTEENFTTNNNDTDASWSFQWYEGDQTNGSLSQLKPLDAPKNAGIYTLVAKVTSTNYTPAECRTVVTIEPKSIILNVQDTNRKYGEPNPEFTCLAKDETLVTGDQLTDLGVTLTTDATEDSEPGEYDIVAEGVATNTNYNVTVNKGKLTINKKEAISLEEEQSYFCTTGSDGEVVTIDVKSKLPEDIGTASYNIEVSNDSDIIDGVAISDNGKLTYKVPATNNTSAGKKATITVTIGSTHYEDSIYKVTVELTDNIVYSGKDGALVWSIDKDGLLTVTGNGDRDLNNTKPQWCTYSTSIKEAKLNISDITNLSYMFDSCSNLTVLDLSNFDTSNVTYMNNMFDGCNNLIALDLNNFDTSNVTSMERMFGNCRALTVLDLSNFNTSNVTTMNGMFYGCNNLATLNLNKFNTNNVTDMQSMFGNCNSLTTLDLSNFDTGNVTNAWGMFDGCSKLASLDLSSNFNTSKITDMRSMFEGCSKLTTLDLSNFNTSNVLYMNGMFRDCSNLTTLDLSNFDISNITEILRMFEGCNELTTLVAPANIKASIPLPTSSTNSDYWVNEDGKTCTEITTNLAKSMTYTKIIIKDVNNVEDMAYDVIFEKELVYNGEMQERTFDLIIQSEEKTLIKDEDYTYTVTGNTATNAGDYKLLITVTGIGDYTGSFTIEQDWSIAKAPIAPSIPKDAFSVEIKDGQKVSDIPLNAYPNWKWIEEDSQKELPTKAGEILEATAEYVGKDAANYDKITQTVTITMISSEQPIEKKDISDATYDFSLVGNIPIYTGNEQSTDFSLSIQSGEKVLVEGTDYICTITGNTGTNAGDYKLTISVTGIGNYTGNFTIEKDWSIAKASIAPNAPKDTFSVEIKDGQKVSGIPLDAYPNWKWIEADSQKELPTTAGEILEVTAEYVGVDAVNYEVITQPVTITMIEKSEKPVEKENIADATYDFSLVGDSLAYTGNEQSADFSLSIQSGEKILEEGTDYICTVTGNTATNTGDYKLTITVTGIGNYTGNFSIEKDWSIAKASTAPGMPKDAFSVEIKDGQKVSDVSLDAYPNWKWIEADSQKELPTKAAITLDVTAEYVGIDATNYEVITQTVTITMIEKSEQPVEKENIADATYDVTLVGDSLVYTGNKQKIDFSLSMQSNETKLIAGTDYICTVTGNTGINAGNYKLLITVTGIGDYAGSFTIEQDWSIAKAPTAPGMPKDAFSVEIKNGLKVSDISLDAYPNWKWIDTDSQKELPTKSGETLDVTAEYVGKDATNYEKITQPVAITMINGSGSSSSGGSNNNPSGGTSGSGGGGSSTVVTTPPTDTNNTATPTQPDQENTDNNNNTDNTKPSNPNTTTETKPDGTIVETTTQTATNGNSVITVTETKPDGSTAETKTITAEDSDTVLTITKENNQQGTNTSAVISTGEQGNVIVPAKLLETVAEDESVKGYVIEISSPTITAGQKLIKNTVVTINLPSTDGISAEDIILTQDSIQTAKETGKGLKIVVTTENGSTNAGNSNYTVTIPSKQLSKIDNSIDTVSIAMSINTQNDKINNPGTSAGLKTALTNSRSKAEKTCVISTAKNETLDNVGMKLQVDVTNVTDVKAGNKVYIYKYNEKTGKLEELANSKQTVASDGTVSIEGYSGTDYVVSAKKLTGKSVVTIKNGIRLNVKKSSVKQGKKLPISLILPDTVSTGNKFGTEKATIVYKSNNPKIVSVSKKGVIAAKKAGKATITVVIKLESGQKITKTKKITIK